MPGRGARVAANSVVHYEGDEDEAPFAHLLGRLVEGNLAVRPNRRGDFERLRGSVGFEATDIEESATLTFAAGRLTVRGGLAPERTLTIRGDTASILELSNLAIGPLGLPVYFDSHGRGVVSRLLRRDLRVDGMWRHPGMANRVTRLFSVR